MSRTLGKNAQRQRELLYLTTHDCCCTNNMSIHNNLYSCNSVETDLKVFIAFIYVICYRFRFVTIEASINSTIMIDMQTYMSSNRSWITLAMHKQVLTVNKIPINTLRMQERLPTAWHSFKHKWYTMQYSHVRNIVTV